MSVAARRRRSPLTAASGSGQIAYHGSTQAVDASSASVLQPAATRQSAPRAVRHSAPPSTAKKPTTNRSRHQPGVPLSPTRRAVSAGMLCVETSCCCSPIAPKKPSACTPKPISPTIPTAISAAPALRATRTRSRVCDGASTRNGSASPAVSLIPTPATSAPAAARGWEPTPPAPALSSRATARASSISVSLCAPPTASTRTTGFNPTNAAAQAPDWPRRLAARAISATAPRLEATAIALNAHSPPARPSGAIA
jgi:hypothetical protein